LSRLIDSSRVLTEAAPGGSEDATMVQLQELSQEASDLLRRLRKLYDDIVVKLRAMEHASSLLAADIAATASAFHIHADSRRTIDDAVAVLSQIALQIDALTPAGSGADDRYLQTLRARFTMQSERDIFNTVHAEPVASPVAAPAEHDFGDNVEFF
jgi:hypothetical protein